MSNNSIAVFSNDLSALIVILPLLIVGYAVINFATWSFSSVPYTYSSG